MVGVTKIGGLAIAAVTRDALPTEARPDVVGMAVTAGREEVFTLERKLSEVVVITNHHPVVGAMAASTIEEGTAAVRVAVTRTAIRIWGPRAVVGVALATA